MNLKDVHYNAFISYRHCEPDMFVAKNLHKTLEAFKLPSNIRKEHPELPAKVERVFRDQEELPLVSNLADPITEALRNSDLLIVICTPRLKESMWCLKEIETFISFHGREKVMAVLAEGEPEDSFPPQLLYDENGNPVEPLGADFRGKTKSEILRKMKTESLRLIAPMFELNFDDLRQRHKEQKARRTITICAIIIVLLLAFGIYSTSMAMIIKQQSEEIKARTREIAAKYAVTVAEDSVDVISLGDKRSAIKMLREVMPDNKDDEIVPYTPECERALANCLSVYAPYSNYLPYECIKTENSIVTLGMSTDGKYLFYGETDKDIVVVDVDSCKEVYRTQKIGVNDFYNAVIVGHKLFYCGGFGELYSYDIDTGEEKLIAEYSNCVRTISGTDYLYTSGFAVTQIFDANTEEKILEINISGDGGLYNDPSLVYMDANNIYVDLTPTRGDDDSKGMIQIYDISSGRLKDEVSFGKEAVITSLTTDEDMLYAAINDDTDSIDYNNYLVCYDMTSKKVVYKTKDSNRTLKNLGVSVKDGQKYLFAIDNYQPFSFDIDTGEMLYTASFESFVADSFDIGEGYEALIMENGEIYVYSVDSGFSFENSYFSFPFNERVYHYCMGTGVMAFHDLKSNVIGVYKQSYDYPITAFDPESEYVEATYDDTGIEIPSTGLKLIRTDEGYGIFDSDDNCIADMPYCLGCDENGSSLIFSEGDEYYAVQIYSYEELIATADEYLATADECL